MSFGGRRYVGPVWATAHITLYKAVVGLQPTFNEIDSCNHRRCGNYGQKEAFGTHLLCRGEARDTAGLAHRESPL